MDRKSKERLLVLLREKEKRQQQLNKLYSETNDCYIPLLNNASRYLVLMGGGGSGKSIFAGRKILHRMVTEKGHRFLVVRKVGRTLRESCFRQLQGQISEYYNSNDWHINKTDMSIKYVSNGNEILFASLDDVEKLKSIYNITGIWIEEASEIDESDFNQLDIRLRGVTKNYKQFIISFNPIDIMHWLKKVFFDSNKEDVTISRTTYKNNRFLDEEAIKVLISFKDTDPYYYDVYCCGNWGVLGQSIFDKQKVTERLLQAREINPIKQGFFKYNYDGLHISNIKWVDDATGSIKIYKDVAKNRPYVVGCDTSGDGSDYFVNQVIDNSTGEQIAILKQQYDEDLYTKQTYCLGMYFNTALIGIETNFSTYPTNELQRLGYPRQYLREVEDSISHKIEQRFGFKTTSLTRPLIIAELVQIVREHTELFNDADTLSEMLTFVRNEKGKPCAQDGAHDDTIMAMAITYYIRTQQSFKVSEEPQQPKNKLTDQFKKKPKIKM